MGPVRILLDTPALLWWLFDDPALTATARDAIARPQCQVFVSSASAWEISTKARLGQLPEAGDVPDHLGHYVRRNRFSPLAITLDHALAAGALPGPHRDPFDRMLIAQARIEDLTVITRNPAFARYEVPVCW